MPEAPPNTHTFNELKSNELTDAVDLIASGSIRAHIVSLLAAADDDRVADARVAIAMASWATKRPQQSLHACVIAVAAEVGAACIHAQNINEIITSCLMPSQNDDKAKRVASAIRNSTLALVGNGSTNCFINTITISKCDFNC